MKTYVTPDGREVPIPAEILAVAKFKRDGTPDRRVKAFDEWADAQDKAVPCAECDEVGRHADDCGTGGVLGNQAAQEYARRVWDGQSTDIARHVRLERVRRALEAQGWTMEGITL